MDQGPNTFSQMTGIWKLIRATSAVGLAMSSLGKPCYGMFCPKSILHYLTSSYIICAFICSYDCDWLPSSRGEEVSIYWNFIHFFQNCSLTFRFRKWSLPVKFLYIHFFFIIPITDFMGIHPRWWSLWNSFVEKGLNNPDLCRGESEGSEDVEMGELSVLMPRLIMIINKINKYIITKSFQGIIFIGKCMQSLGVVAGDSRDNLGQKRFFPFVPEIHVLGARLWWW